MRWMFAAVLALGVACGSSAEECDPLDLESCGEDICQLGANGAHCGPEGRLGVALANPLEPCSDEMPCPNGFICLSYSCFNGSFAYWERSSDIRKNGCLPLCDMPVEYDPEAVGPQCIFLGRNLATDDYGLDLTTELVAAACDQ